MPLEMSDTNNKVLWHAAKYEHIGCPLLGVAFFFWCGVVIIHRSWKWLLRGAACTQATSQRCRPTVLLICYCIFLLTCLPVWANMASKRWRLPLSTHAADWLSFPSTQAATHTHHSDSVRLFFPPPPPFLPLRWRDVGVIWGSCIRSRAQYWLMRVF